MSRNHAIVEGISNKLLLKEPGDFVNNKWLTQIGIIGQVMLE